jgi:hypothetical protein
MPSKKNFTNCVKFFLLGKKIYTPVQFTGLGSISKVKCKDCDLEPVTFAFTDKCGQFLFGVESHVEYVIKVFFYKPECGDIKDDDDCILKKQK